MSAALQMPVLLGSASAQQPAWPAHNDKQEKILSIAAPATAPFADDEEENEQEARPSISLAFYRKHTESMLRRYLYASMQVGRTPSVLGGASDRGRASSRRVRTFEDAVIFVLDMENCLKRLSVLDRALISRITLQEYTQAETAKMLGMSLRAVNYKLHHALDRMTERLLDADLLDLPH